MFSELTNLARRAQPHISRFADAAIAACRGCVAAYQQGRNKLARRIKKEEIEGWWPNLFDGMQFSAQEFYAKVEAELAARKVPDLKLERIDWKEGGALTARREYLRMSRERQSFDLCAAPFGTGFFVSLWFRERPLRFGFLSWLLLALALAAGVLLLFAIGGARYQIWRLLHAGGIDVSLGSVTNFLAITFAVGVAGAMAIAGPNLDQMLIQIPVVGYIYERWFRKETLYRHDLAAMYRTMIHQIVEKVIDDVSQVQGIAPMSELERRPVMRGLFEPRGSHGRH